jgi:signal transduction histidine kinase
MHRRLRSLPLGVWLALAIALAVTLPALAATATWLGVRANQRADVDRRVSTATRLIAESSGVTNGLLAGLARLNVEAELEPLKSVVVDRAAGAKPVLDSDQALYEKKLRGATEAPSPFMTDGLAATLKNADGKRILQDRYLTFPIDKTSAHATLFVPRPSSSVRTAAASGVALVLLALVLVAGFILLRRWVVRPLGRLSADAEAIAGGGLEFAPVTSRAREIAEVGAALHGMADGLRSALGERAAAEEQRRFLVTAIAHDLRTPLFTLRGSLEAIEHGIGDGDHLRRAQDKAKLLDGLVSDLFVYSRLEYAGPDLQRQTLDAGALAREAAQAVDDRIVVTAPAGALTIEGDHRALLRVLINLLDNAVRHANARVDLVVWAEQDSVVWEVTDDGAGVDPDDLPHLFEPLFRADRTRNSATGGAGLGLAIVERLTTAQGAVVHAENLPSGGARFTVRHPLGC